MQADATMMPNFEERLEEASTGKRGIPLYAYGYLLLSAIIVCFICSGMGIYPFNDESDPQFGQVMAARLLYNSMFIAMLTVLGLFYQQTMAVLLRYKLLVALIVVYFLSIVISINHKESLLFAIRIGIFTTYFAVLTTVLERKHLLRFLVSFFAVFGIINMLYIAIMPTYGLMAGIHSGAFRGLFSHKNQFGYFCAYGVVLFSLCTTYSRGLTALLGSLAMVGFFGVMLVGSHSSGALTAAGFGLLAALAILYTPKIHTTVKVVWLSVISMFTVAIIPFFDAIMSVFLQLLGRDPSLTNRADLWALYMQEYLKSPILGLGANAYNSDPGIRMRIQSALNVDAYFSPHNGYLDILLQVGAVGMLIYVLMVAGIIGKGIARSFGGGTFLHKLLVVLTIMHAVRGTVETNGSIQLTIYFALIVVAYVGLDRNQVNGKPLGKHAVSA